MQHLREADRANPNDGFVPDDVLAERAIAHLRLHALAAILRPSWWEGAEFACPACQPREKHLVARAPRANITADGWHCGCGAGGNRRVLADLLLRDPDVVAQLATLEVSP